jgi:cysteinyl-tRNA synthetase
VTLRTFRVQILPDPTTMALRIFNTLARELQVLEPLTPGHVRMYVCGMTVYDLCHMGHARSMVAFDVVQRWLKQSGLQQNHPACH